MTSAVESYLERLSAADQDGALEVARRFLHDGSDFVSLVEQVIGPAQEEVGRRWQRNEWSVAQEHAATAISQAVVAVLAAERSSPAKAGIALVTCVEGEWHSLAAQVIAESLSSGGWRTVTLGPSAPVSQVGAYIHDLGPDALVITCSVPMNLPGARRLIEVGRRSGLPVLAGGRAFGDDGARAERLGASAWAATAAGAAQALAAAEPFTGPAPALTHAGAAEHARLEGRLEPLVRELVEALRARIPSVADYDELALDRTREDLLATLRFTSAALLCDDPVIVLDFVTWLIDVLTARGGSRSTVRESIVVIADHLAADLPLAARLLVSAV